MKGLSKREARIDAAVRVGFRVVYGREWRSTLRLLVKHRWDIDPIEHAAILRAWR